MSSAPYCAAPVVCRPGRRSRLLEDYLAAFGPLQERHAYAVLPVRKITFQVRGPPAPYPRVRVQGDGGQVVSQAGSVLLVETVRRTGLDQAMSAGPAPWWKPRVVHDPGRIRAHQCVANARFTVYRHDHGDA
jgi:hypothetical protein